MKTVERILMGLAILLIIAVGIAYLLPSSWQVDKSIVIHATPAAIDPFVGDLRRWNEWVPWTKDLDPTVHYTFEGPEMGAGSTMIWNGDKMGHGILTIREYHPSEGIQYSIAFGDGKMPSMGSIQFRAVQDGTEVQWHDHGELGNNPVSRYMGLLMNSLLKEDFEKGLVKLKQKVESSTDLEEPQPNINSK